MTLWPNYLNRTHFLVLNTRCEGISEEIIEVNGSKYHERWSHLSKKVVVSFLNYIYSGIVDLELTSLEDLESAKYFYQNYPNLESWKLYTKSIIAENDFYRTS